MTSVVEQQLKMRDDVVTDGGYADDVMRERAAVRRQFLRRAQGGGVMAAPSDPTRLTIAEAREALAGKDDLARAS